MTTPADRVQVCKQIRKQAAEEVARLVAQRSAGISETEFCNALIKYQEADVKLWPTGWYDPPPGGVSALFTQPDDFSRLQYDTLRKEAQWPRTDMLLNPEGCAAFYLSPVHRATGTIGDFGLTIYTGPDRSVRKHFESCASVLRHAAEYAEVGMEFRDIHEQAQRLCADAGLTNGRTITWTDTAGTNLGHTVPWSYENPTEEESRVIAGSDFTALKNLISKKRVHVNSVERFVVPKNIAFTLEARLESVASRALPNVFYHFMVTFVDGKKETLENFDIVFLAAGMEPL